MFDKQRRYLSDIGPLTSTADLITYILVCQQMRNFVVNPIMSLWRFGGDDHTPMFDLMHAIDYIKVCVCVCVCMSTGRCTWSLNTYSE